MVYVCSDIHAQYDLFVKLLARINFCNNDVMYIGGDVIDKGNDSVRLMHLIMKMPNVHVIKGNHEHDFLKYYWRLMKQSPTDFNGVLKKLQGYFAFDGHLLDWDTVDFIEALPYCLQTDNFILVHAGLPIDNNNRVVSLNSVNVEYLVYDRVFKGPNLLPQTDKCVFYGHTPSNYICGEHKIIKYKRAGAIGNSISDYCKIHLDVGSWIEGNILGCFCVDNCKEYYVYEKD